MSKCTPEIIRLKKFTKLVGAHGLEPWTSSLSETRSNQLSYAPKKCHDARKRRGGLEIPFPSVILRWIPFPLEKNLQRQNSVIQRA